MAIVKEKGDFLFPCGQYEAVREAIIDRANQIRRVRYTFAHRTYAVNLCRVQTSMAGPEVESMLRTWMRNADSELHISQANALIETLVDRKSVNGRMRIPRRADAPFQTIGTGKRTILEGDTVELSFDDANRKIHWKVAAGENASETARSTSVGRALFEVLNRVQWKNRYGGYIRQYTEYAPEGIPVDCHGSRGMLWAQRLVASA